jgi:hypothetical protein
MVMTCACGRPVEAVLVNLLTGDLLPVCEEHVPDEMILDFVREGADGLPGADRRDPTAAAGDTAAAA